MSATSRLPRPLTRTQRLENAAFLRELRRTGNAREAARRLGAHRAKFTKRRAAHPAFAAAWDAALALAHAALRNEAATAPSPQVVRSANGRLQLRKALPGRIDGAAQQAFLVALSASANIRLAAKAAGFSHAAFYHHKRSNPAFAREWRLALQRGYESLELALIESCSHDAHEFDHWRDNAPPPIPPMTVSQALQLLYLHQKEAKLWTEPEALRRRRGESHEARSVRLSLIYEARLEHQRELFRVAEAGRRARGEPCHSKHAPEPPQLPDLAQVTGWSKASGKEPHDPGRALFGGWRLKD
jgi:hypothetical protein